MSTKKNLLIVELVSISLILLLIYVQNGDICYSRNWCRGLWEEINLLGEMLLVVISVFPFLLITYRMKDGVFRTWWNFARWFVPIIIVVTFLQNIAPKQSGFGGVTSGSFNFLVLVIFYSIFVIVSLVRIILAYKYTK